MAPGRRRPAPPSCVRGPTLRPLLVRGQRSPPRRAAWLGGLLECKRKGQAAVALAANAALAQVWNASPTGVARQVQNLALRLRVAAPQTHSSAANPPEQEGSTPSAWTDEEKKRLRHCHCCLRLFQCSTCARSCATPSQLPTTAAAQHCASCGKNIYARVPTRKDPKQHLLQLLLVRVNTRTLLRSQSALPTWQAAHCVASASAGACPHCEELPAASVCATSHGSCPPS